MCASFCTYSKVLDELKNLKQFFADITPIMSENSCRYDTRFGSADAFIQQLEEICGKPVIKSIPDAEPIGPKALFDVLVVAPCTGNTLAKLANGIADTTVTLACKSHLRNSRPVVIGVSTNDGLGANARNIGILMARKNIYFVPFYQDDPEGKPNSLVADMGKIKDTASSALQGLQIQPVLLKR